MLPSRMRIHVKSLLIFTTVFVVTSCEKNSDISSVPDVQSQEEELLSAAVPRADHIVIVVLENHSYNEIIGSGSAPYINSLSKDPYSANFTNSYAIEHPSQPNYLDLYAGANQGVTDDGHPSNEPFTTANLGRQLIDAGKSYSTYSEGLPSVGYNGDSYGAYVRKHNPAANWMGSKTNQIPTTTNQPLTAFPADYTKLPTVSIVVPNLNNDMHDGSIKTGDSWVKSHLDAYVQWAKTHNSLFILTFDEDDDSQNNHIATIFTGAKIKGGQYTNKINHYRVLRTIEAMYHLPYAGNAANVRAIGFCWK